jgi:hypothetical protein
MGLVIGVQSHQVVCQVFRWGKLRDTVHVPLAEQGAWEAALQGCLAQHALPRQAVTVYVGAPHMQWLLETWPLHVRTRQDFLAYLEYQASQAFPRSKQAGAWQVGLDARARMGDTLPIALLDPAFLQALTSRVQAHGNRLRSVQPLLQVCWQQAKKTRTVQINQEGVLVFDEPNWLTMFGVREGGVVSVRSVRLNGLNHNVPGLAQHYAQSIGALAENVQCISVGL